MKRFSKTAWEREGRRRFGPDPMKWAFVCPSCGIRISLEDYKAAKAPETALGFNCIGRYRKNPQEAFTGGPGPCNYTSGGLIGISPVEVEIEGKFRPCFAFAPKAD